MPRYTQAEVEEMLRAENPAAEPRHKLSVADVERMMTPIPVDRDDSGPGIGPSYVRGALVEGPSQVVGGLGYLTDAMVELGAKAGIPAAQAIAPISASDVLGQAAHGSLDQAVGIGQPVTDAEKTAHAAGVGTAFGLAAAPFALAAGPGVAAAEVGLATLGGAAGEELRQGAESRGAGELGQGIASGVGDLLISAAAPAGVIAKGPDVVQGAKNIGAAFKASPEVAEIARKLGVPVRALVRDAGEFKRYVPRHASGDERYIDEWVDALREGSERFGPDEMPTTRQLIEAQDDSGSALASLEEGLGRGSQDFSADVAGRRKASVGALRDEYDSLRPDGSPSVATTAFERIRDQRWDAQARLWDEVPREELPMIQTARLKAAAAESVERAGEFPSRVPEEARRVLEWPDEVPWDQYQKMRSEILFSDRIGRKSTAESISQRRTKNLGPLKRGFNDELSRLVAESGGAGAEYGRALKATAKFYDDFDSSSVAVRAFEDYAEGPKIVARIKNAKKPQEEAARAVRVLSQEPGGLESFQRMFFDDLIGVDELNPGSAKAALKNLRKNENVAREVMGDSYDSAIDLLERARVVSIGKTGKSAQAMSVGSGASPLESVIAPASAFVDPAGSASGIVKRMIQKALKEGVVTSRILREAALDPVLARTLLEMPTPRSVEAWAVNWKRLVARATARTSARKATD